MQLDVLGTQHSLSTHLMARSATGASDWAKAGLESVAGSATNLKLEMRSKRLCWHTKSQQRLFSKAANACCHA